MPRSKLTPADARPSGSVRFALGMIVAILVAPAWATRLIDASDLQADGQAHSERPIMLEFAARHCSYCELLEREILRPMLNNPALREQVLIRRIDLDSSRPIKDFDGRRSDAATLARRYEVSLTPTLVFVDAGGREIAERLIGVYSLDYYGGFVDQRIAEAGDQLRRSSRSSERKP